MQTVDEDSVRSHQKVIINFKMIMAMNFFAVILGMIFNQRFDLFNIAKADFGFFATCTTMTFGLIFVVFFSVASARSRIEPILIMLIAFLVGCLFDMLIKKNISNEQTYLQIIPSIQLAVASGLFTTLIVSTTMKLLEISSSFSFVKIPVAPVIIGFGVALVVLSQQLENLNSFTISLMLLIVIVMFSYSLLTVKMSNIPKPKLEQLCYEGVNFVNLQTLTLLIFCTPLAFFAF